MNKKLIKSQAYIVVSEIAVVIDGASLGIYDLRNTKNTAEVIYEEGEFQFVSSTFAVRGKRLYESMYILEKNKARLIKQIKG